MSKLVVVGKSVGRSSDDDDHEDGESDLESSSDTPEKKSRFSKSTLSMQHTVYDFLLDAFKNHHQEKASEDDVEMEVVKYLRDESHHPLFSNAKDANEYTKNPKTFSHKKFKHIFKVTKERKPRVKTSELSPSEQKMKLLKSCELQRFPDNESGTFYFIAKRASKKRKVYEAKMNKTTNMYEIGREVGTKSFDEERKTDILLLQTIELVCDAKK